MAAKGPVLPTSWAGSALPLVNIKSETLVAAPLANVAIHEKMNIAPATAIDEDESGLSSVGTDPSEVFSNGSEIRKGRWSTGDVGAWRRYGSSESATSTAMSSQSPSITSDQKSVKRPSLVLTSKKRQSDGTLKISPTVTPPVINSPSIGVDPIKQSPGLTTPVLEKQRRGRKPKEKAASSAYSSTKRRASSISRFDPAEVRPRSSIPTRVPAALFASQCIKAAHSSRLDPYALHPGENDLLSNLLMNQEVTVYLNIRNAILRLWCQNPCCSVTAEEAAGCAKDSRFFGLTEVAYKWLVRFGYINFGCVEPPRLPASKDKNIKNMKQKTVVVVGAGVSGLTTARQLEGLFAQNAEAWIEQGEQPPRVIVLEGKKRIGGRVYSKPLRSQEKNSLPQDLRNTAEMGAMIVTGFEHGNPLDVVIRGQLGLHYHLMTDRLTIYDCDGKPVNERQDMLNTDLYTDISDRAGKYRATPQRPQTLRGDEDLVKRCRDPLVSGFDTFQMEPMFDPLDTTKRPSYKRGRRRNAPPGTEKLTGRSRVVEESNTSDSAAQAVQEMGWALQAGVAAHRSISLEQIANANIFPTLGAVMDGAIEQYQTLINIKPRDMRLLNWHHANLEYANAAPVSSLSLSGHDQDTGNEFEGAHSEIIGGYTQLPRGLMSLPTKLNVRFNRSVESIHYEADGSGAIEGLSTKVVMTDGEVIEADQVVVTAPLGVLKTDMIDFDPPLPPWKRGAINRMGFGLLNKVILLYDKPFWDEDRDMFGLLNEPDQPGSLNPAHYAKNRGRFYLIWNASKTSGRPTLIALMAGKAAHEVEGTDTNSLLQEITDRLRKAFSPAAVPAPREVIVTRWKRDPFTRGTYSYVGPETRPSDYDLMAESVGNLHFAGEATCGTHPATVHGAFLSGLRVAADVMESLVGPIRLPEPLVQTLPLPMQQASTSSPFTPISRHMVSVSPRKTQNSLSSMASGARTNGNVLQSTDLSNVSRTVQSNMFAEPISTAPRQSVCAGDSSFWAQPVNDGAASANYEAAINAFIYSQIDDRPIKPARPGVNPFLMYTKEKWNECKSACSSGTTVAGRDLIRQTIGKWWKQASEEVKQPYLVQSQLAQEQADASRKEWEQSAAQWDLDEARLRAEYIAGNPKVEHSNGQTSVTIKQENLGVSKRKTNVSNNVVLDHV